MTSQPLYRCMGGQFCNHTKGTCTATSDEYRKTTAAKAEKGRAEGEPEFDADQIIGSLFHAAEWFKHRRQPMQAKFNLHGPQDTAIAMEWAFNNLETALAVAKEYLASKKKDQNNDDTA